MYRFFTSWVNILVILFSVPVARVVNLPHLTTLTMFVGSYLSFCHPRVFYVEWPFPMTVSGWFKVVAVDLLCHLIPWLYCLSALPLSLDKVWSSFILLVLYMCMLDPKRVYRARTSDMLVPIVAANVLFMLMTSISA